MTSISPIRVAPPMHLSPGESAARAFTARLHSTHTWCGVVATRDLIIRANTCRVLLPTLQARRWYLFSEQLRKCNSVPGDSKDAMQWPLSHPRGCYTPCCILYILQPKGQCFYMAGHPAGDRRLNPRQTSIWLLFCGQAHIFWEKFQFQASKCNQIFPLNCPLLFNIIYIESSEKCSVFYIVFLHFCHCLFVWVILY